jgi:hypothetical protein
MSSRIVLQIDPETEANRRGWRSKATCRMLDGLPSKVIGICREAATDLRSAYPVTRCIVGSNRCMKLSACQSSTV